MLKVKTIILTLSLLACTFLYGCGGADSSTPQDSSDSSTSQESLGVCSIEYKYFDEELDRETDIPQFLWQIDGNYPTSYQESSEQWVDDLRNFRKDDDTIYAFEGWYYDVEYTNELTDNVVDSACRGDITLYAKIVERAKTDTDVVIASITYKWKEFDIIKEGISTFPEGMVEDFTFPTEYEEGKAITLPTLKKWKPNKDVTYEFGGWYYESSHQNELLNGVIPATQTGNVTVYAAISIWVG